MAKYENPIKHACDIQEGQTRISVDRFCPVGMCSFVWGTMRPFIESLSRGEGNFIDG